MSEYNGLYHVLTRIDFFASIFKPGIHIPILKFRDIHIPTEMFISRLVYKSLYNIQYSLSINDNKEYITKVTYLF